MKAIIMAGGQGTRLRPITCDCPKPMLPLMGRPLMAHAVDLLRRHGIAEIAATLGYLPEAATAYFGDAMQYYIERTPLGTAGGVKRAEAFLDERFIVLSGDGVADFDLSAAIRFHQQRRALATLILKPCDTPQEYGVVCVDSDGRVRSFHEKPGRCDVFSDLVNTGAYILEPEVLARIPADRPFDFGHDLFPAMVAEGLPVYGWSTDDYWCDVGGIGAYLAVHRDALAGKIHLPALESLSKSAFIAPDAHIDPDAVIGDGCAIGNGCRVEAGASLRRCVLLDGVHVRSGAQLRGCVVCAGADVGEGAELYEESVVGSGAIVGARTRLRAGVRLWPEKTLPADARPRQNVVWGANEAPRFEGGALRVRTPEQCALAAAACVSELKPREILIGHGASAVAMAMALAAAAGAMAQGTRVIDAGTVSLGQLRHAQASLCAESALLVRDDRVLILNADGAPIPAEACRRILHIFVRQDFAAPFSAIALPMETVGRTDLSYIAALAALFSGNQKEMPLFCLCCGEARALELAERAFERVGLRVRTEWNEDCFAPEADEIGIVLADDGQICRFSGFDEPTRQLMCAWTAMELGQQALILPMDASLAVETLCARRGIEIRQTAGDRAAWLNELAKSSPLQFRLHCDGAACALAFLDRLAARGLSIEAWKKEMPRACRFCRDVNIPRAHSGYALGTLAREVPKSRTGGGVHLPAANGWAWLTPNDAEDSYRLTAEAHSMEAAREIFDFYNGRIGEILRHAQRK